MAVREHGRGPCGCCVCHTTRKDLTITRTATTRNADTFFQQQPLADSPALPDTLRLLTYQQAANLLGVCKKTVENLCRVRKEIPLTYVARSPRIKMGDVIAYLHRGGSNPTGA
jgi:excisionase family DNA binding protein